MPSYPRAQPLRAHRGPLTLLLLAVVLLLLAATPGSAADNCEVCSPAAVVPSDRWGGLEPRGIISDQTSYQFNFEPGCQVPMYTDVAAQGNLLFAVGGNQIEVWPLNVNPDDPEVAGRICTPTLGPWKRTDQDFYIRSVAAPPGVDDVVIGGIEGGMGVIILDTTNPVAMKLRYQDEGRKGVGSGEVLTILDVEATTINGRHVGFAVAQSKNIFAYDMSAVLDLTTNCYEGTQQNELMCPGVYIGQVSSAGVPVQSNRLIAVSGKYLLTTGSAGVPQVWDVSLPTNARLVATGGSNSLDLETWLHAGRLYTAFATGQEVEVYEVPCLTGGSCNMRAVTTISTPGGPNAANIPTKTNRLQYSFDQGVPYLFAGTRSAFGSGPQREYLFDMAVPTAPKDLTPQSHPDGYWGWYYQDNSTGFRNVAPYGAAVRGGRVYRAAWSIFDIHEVIGNLPPQADFELPGENVYGGDSVSFIDSSSRNPTSWTWWFDFANDTTPDSTLQNPSWLVPDEGAYPRTYQVRLEACNDSGCDVSTRNFVVFDPRPSVDAVSANVSSVPQCGTVSFQAESVLGRAPLTYQWSARQAGVGALATGSEETFSWTVPSDQAAGSYFARVKVKNDVGEASVNSSDFEVTALADLGDPQITAGSPDFGEVDFQVAAAGATQWDWNFGDGDTFSSSDPLAGPNPTHQYTAVGTYEVTVTVSNCRDGQRSTSTTVVVNNVEVLEVRQFKAQIPFCSSGLCFANAGTPVAFNLGLGGSPERVDLDWDGNGSIDETINDPARDSSINHTYTTNGDFKPRVTAVRGGASVTFTHSDTIRIGTGTPPPADPSVTISGPSSVVVDATATFTATARDCTPAPTAWAWTVGTATSSGPLTTRTVTLSWDTIGAKSISVTPTNGGCTSVSRSKSVSVREDSGGVTPPDGNGGLDPQFTLDVPAPAAGQTVNFDATGSAGNAESFHWFFGDGEEASGGSEVAKIAHTYSEPGTYTVTLEISKVDAACQPFRFCTATITQKITVGQSTGGTCTASSKKMCLRSGRFEIFVNWTNQQGDSGKANVVPLATSDSGLFWFFNERNWEMLVKVLDGCSQTEHFWVFAASTTDQKYTMKVTDTVTGESVIYRNPLGTRSPAITDTLALPCSEDDL